MRCVGDSKTSEWCVEEVWVCIERVVESVLAMLNDHVEVVVGDCCILLKIVKVLEFGDSQGADVSIIH